MKGIIGKKERGRGRERKRGEGIETGKKERDRTLLLLSAERFSQYNFRRAFLFHEFFSTLENVFVS